MAFSSRPPGQVLLLAKLSAKPLTWVGYFSFTIGSFVGKSLSLICGALTWYLASEKKRKEELEKQVTGKVDEEDEVVGLTQIVE